MSDKICKKENLLTSTMDSVKLENIFTRKYRHIKWGYRPDREKYYKLCCYFLILEKKRSAISQNNYSGIYFLY